MFDNVGGKIKGFAKFICWAGIIASVICAAVFILGALSGGTDKESSTLLAVYGVLTLVFGILVSWISSFKLYGYGELIDKVMDIEETVYEIKSRMENEEEQKG